MPSEPHRSVGPLAAVLAVIVTMLAVPSRADADPNGGNADQRRERLTAELDVLTASDDELERVVADLTDAVLRQRADATAAAQAAAVTEQARAQAEARVQAAAARVDDAQALVVERAVEILMRAPSARLDALSDARDAADVARRQAFLDVIAGTDADAADQLAVAERDLASDEEVAATRAEEAGRRHSEAVARLAELEAARTQQAQAEAALEERIRSFRAEIDAIAAEQRRLAAVLDDSGTGPLPASSTRLIWPVRGRVTSEYGPRWGRMHEGTDIAAPTGTPIVAAQAGRVTFAGQQGGYGNIVIVDHGGGFTTVYPHQSRLAATKGQAIAQGEIIGYIGCSGTCTGPHVHFETRVNGTAKNPRRYLA